MAKIKAKGGAKAKRSRAGNNKQLAHNAKDTSTAGSGKVTSALEKAVENKEAITYVFLFLFFCLVFYLVYYALTLRGSLSVLKNLTALILGTLFSVGGANVILNGATVSINGFGLEIIDECTAIFSSIVFSAAVLAYPTTAKNKVLGIAFGVPSLYAINILRLVILALVGISHPTMFDFVHVYLWQASFIIFVVVLFLLWLKVIDSNVK